MRLRASHSLLRTQLLWFLLVAISITAVAQALVAYRTARFEPDEIFDHHMQQIATALRSGRPLGVPVATNDEPHDEENFDFIVQVWVSGKLRVF